jgi:serine/threonine protein kinase
LERFQREAEVIAALNHPNIVTIYSIQQDRDRRFLTMELVEGESLDQALPDDGLSTRKVLDLGAVLAEALAAAHEKGIVHRDLKPSNVMLNEQGVIKVLDFGLAKVARDAAPHDTEAATQLGTLTQEGGIVGTAAYMSPEQARGEAVDTRSDIFSLGCLLYEAATGQRPFSGSSSIDILHNIIHAEPEPLAERRPDTPLQLQWILRKCLAKAPEDRYQSAAELGVALRSLKKDLDSSSDLPTATSVGIPAAPQSEPAQSRTGMVVAIAAMLAVVEMFVLWMTLRSETGKIETPSVSKSISIERLTSSGKITGAAISPDGNYFAYSLTEEALGQSLGIQQIARGQSLELVPRRTVGYWSVGFTPDGSEVFFAQKGRELEVEGIYRVSTLGGNWQIVADVALDSQIGFSPDGTRMAWFRAQYPEPNQTSMVVANTDGTDMQPLVALAKPDFFVPIFWSGPSWSPDGSLLAASVNTMEPGGLPRIEVYDAQSGAVEWSRDLDFAELAHVCWLREGNGILVVASRHYKDDSQIWLVPYPEGPLKRITNDLLLYRILTLTADGEALLTVAADPKATMWVTASDASATPRQIPTGRQDGYFGFSITPDGRIALPIERGGSYQLALVDLDGTGQTALTSGNEDVLWPRATPDGRIVYVAVTPSEAQLRRIDLDGGNPLTLLTSKSEMVPDVSRDGKWVVYEDPTITGFETLWRLPVAGGSPEQLTTYEAMRVAISPDSSMMAFYYRESVDGRWKLGIAPITGGAPDWVFDGVSTFSRSFVRWTVDGQALLINSMPGDRSNLYRVPFDGGEPVKITDYDEHRLSWVDFSPDGETMVFARTHWTRDAILIRNFR